MPLSSTVLSSSSVTASYTSANTASISSQFPSVAAMPKPTPSPSISASQSQHPAPGQFACDTSSQ
jgi:hypothetical protein